MLGFCDGAMLDAFEIILDDRDDRDDCGALGLDAF